MKAYQGYTIGGIIGSLISIVVFGFYLGLIILYFWILFYLIFDSIADLKENKFKKNKNEI